MAVTQADVHYSEYQGQEGMPVIYSQCIHHYCKDSNHSVTLEYNAAGSLVQAAYDDGEIVATNCSKNRQGLLCGECKDGFALTMYFKVGHETIN